MGPWGCILLHGSYSLRDYSGHLFLWNPAVQEGLGSQGHPAGQRDQGVPSYHSLGGLEHPVLQEGLHLPSLQHPCLLFLQAVLVVLGVLVLLAGLVGQSVLEDRGHLGFRDYLEFHLFLEAQADPGTPPSLLASACETCNSPFSHQRS